VNLFADLSSSVDILDLSRCRSVVPEVARWHHQEWLQGRGAEMLISGTRSEEQLRKREVLLASHCERSSVPRTFIAFADNKPVGSASFVYYQFMRRQIASEWLTNVYVLPEYRRRGIAASLIDKVCDYARTQGVVELCLYTSDQTPYYTKRGWVFRRQAQVQGRRVDVLSRSLI